MLWDILLISSVEHLWLTKLIEFQGGSGDPTKQKKQTIPLAMRTDVQWGRGLLLCTKCTWECSLRRMRHLLCDLLLELPILSVSRATARRRAWTGERQATLHLCLDFHPRLRFDSWPRALVIVTGFVIITIHMCI
jgi:hypothetical protein